MTRALFPDTNVFLHYRFLADVDWSELAGNEVAEVVIARAVLQELNEAKDRHRVRSIRERARRVLQRVEAVTLEGGRLRENVSLSVYQPNLRQTFVEHDLDDKVTDDAILGAVIHHRSAHPEADALLLTADAALRIAARAHDVPVDAMPDALRLADEPNEEDRELRALRAKVAGFEARQPRLAMRFEGGSDRQSFTVADAGVWSNEQFAAYAERMLQSRPAHDPEVVGGDALLRFALSMGPESAEQRARRRDAYIARAKRQREKVELAARSVTLAFECVNEGTAPATNLEVKLEFPAGAMVERPRVADAPPPSQWDIGAAYMYDIWGPNDNVSPPGITGNPPVADFQLRTLAHGRPEQCEELRVVFPTFQIAASFHVRYSVWANEITEPVTGLLHVIVERAAQKA